MPLQNHHLERPENGTYLTDWYIGEAHGQECCVSDEHFSHPCAQNCNQMHLGNYIRHQLLSIPVFCALCASALQC